MVETHQAFLHGRFEARMKFPLGGGTWPAFWLCCRDGWPDGGEIDVVEHYAGDGGPFDFSTGLAESNLHSSRDPITGSTSRGRLRRTRVDAGQWHEYAVEWAPDEIRFYVDGALRGLHRSTDPESANGGWPFDVHPESMLFDVFLQAGKIDGTKMPQQLQVDWVRAYRLAGPI
jgi:beta-glucanase (GH16 family)